MRIFKNKAFERFMLENGIADTKLIAAIKNADKGLIEADIGGGVIKQRIARENGGKSGGYRTIVYYRKAQKAFFVYGYAKKDKSNISQEEKKAFKTAAKIMLGLSDKELEGLVKNKKLTEVRDEKI